MTKTTFATPTSPRPITIYLHFEDPASCKAWRISLESIAAGAIGGTLWRVPSEWGPAERTAAGATPAIKPALKQKRTYLDAGAPFQEAAEEFVRRVQGQLKDGYKIIQKDLPADLDAAITGAAIAAPKMARAGAKNEIRDKLAELLDPAHPEKTPVLLDGPPGTGKTYSCREYGKTGGFHAVPEVAGNPAMEAIDFLGGMIPLGGGKMIWMDGPVSRAFREASKGRKVLLIIDEFFRIPRRERGVFLNALIPHDGQYRLRTGRPVGINEAEGTASMELLMAPVSNLSIVATTNSGSNYPDVENEDPAGRERWHILHVKPQEGLVTAIIEERAVKRGWAPAVAKHFVKLQSAIRKAREDNYCEKELSPRLALRVFDFAKDQTPAAIEVAAIEMIPALTGRTPDGDIITEQADFLKTAIKMALKV